MSTTSLGDRNCEHVLEVMDSYLDNELTGDAQSTIADHLKQCDSCSRELETRRAIRNRLRSAARNISAAPDFQASIQQSIRANRQPSVSSHAYRTLVPIAAALIICLSAAVSYRLGYLRLTRGSQDSYIASISTPIAAIMRIGLGDHVHCAVFQAFPRQHPTLDQMAQDMGRYKDLTPIIAKQIPAGYRLEMAHQCRYHGRGFVHLTLRNGSALVSLVITGRGEGESFKKGELVPVLSESGIALYQTTAQRFEISGFETRDHLVYVVSNLRPRDNLKMMVALAPSVNSFLQSLQS